MTRKYPNTPPELARVHHVLWADVSLLYQRWTTFTSFYSDQETVSVLEWAAGGFFALLQRVLLDDLYLGIARLADPPSTGAQNNLVLRSLLLHIPPTELPLRDKCDAAIADFEEKAQFARPVRHKRLAHRDEAVATGASSVLDYLVSREDIESALRSAASVLNKVDSHYEDRTTMYSEFIHLKGADTLIARLKRAKELDDKYFKEKLAGTSA
jgi:hypothetical protein